jgi:hypothetical protein
VSGAQRELLKYYASVTSNRWLMLKIFGVLIIFVSHSYLAKLMRNGLIGSSWYLSLYRNYHVSGPSHEAIATSQHLDEAQLERVDTDKPV